MAGPYRQFAKKEEVVTKTQSIWRSVALVALGLVLAGGAVQAAVPASGNPCVVPSNGGTVTLPPAGCGYVGRDQLHMLLDGLPPNTTVILEPAHHKFFCPQGNPGLCVIQGGPLGGDVETFESLGSFQLRGTGALAGWTRSINIPLKVRTATAKRTPGDPVQHFVTDMLRIEGSITNDPDFDLLEIVGGSDYGQPSPGQTTLTDQGNGTFRVVSNFQVGYKIRFIGAPRGKLSGLSGTTEGSVNMGTGQGPCP